MHRQSHRRRDATVLLYRCESSDHPSDSRKHSVTRLISQPTAGATTVIENIACRTCHALLPSAKRAVCDECHAYICKVPKAARGEGCKRDGWSGGGSERVDGMLRCVECRYANDSTWLAFVNLQEQKGTAPSQSTPAMVITLDKDANDTA